MGVLLLAMAATCTGQNLYPLNAKPSEIKGVLSFELHLKQMLPAELVVDSGVYELRIVNGIFTEAVQITINRDADSALLSQKGFDKNNVKNRILAEFQSGKYQLRVQGHPELRSVITVNTKK